MHRSSSAYAVGREDDGALVVRYRTLIERVTRRVAARTGGAVSASELFSAGALGLLAAAQRFDPGRDVTFEAFAEYRVRGAVLDELRGMDPLPRRLRSDTDAVKKAAAKLEQKNGHEATAEEVAQAIGKPLDEVVGLMQVAKPVEPLSDFLTATLTSESPGAEAEVLRKEVVRRLSAEVGRLSGRTQQVLQMHYIEGLTYREIGQVLEVSEVRICQIHKDALAALRTGLKEKDGR
jgi:RNA polymerase sigma factor for flagellar operon FliA